MSFGSPRSAEPPPTPYVKYCLEVEDLLKSYAKTYSPKGPAHSHADLLTAGFSRAITNCVSRNWQIHFRTLQYPLHERKSFPRYDPNDPAGN